MFAPLSKLGGLYSYVSNLYNESKFRIKIGKVPIPQHLDQTRAETVTDQSS